jgi:hypothetical protein
MIEKSENSQTEDFLDDNNFKVNRVTQSMKQKPSRDKIGRSAVYVSTIENGPGSSSLEKNILSESIELEPSRIILRRSNGICIYDIVTPLESIEMLMKRLEGHHGLPTHRMIIKH